MEQRAGAWKAWLGWWELDWGGRVRYDSYLQEHSAPWSLRGHPKGRIDIGLRISVAFGKRELAQVRELVG
jgi:hypothetical protein